MLSFYTAGSKKLLQKPNFEFINKAYSNLDREQTFTCGALCRMIQSNLLCSGLPNSGITKAQASGFPLQSQASTFREMTHSFISDQMHYVVIPKEENLNTLLARHCLMVTYYTM